MINYAGASIVNFSIQMNLNHLLVINLKSEVVL